jgi:hypothetical protein
MNQTDLVFRQPLIRNTLAQRKASTVNSLYYPPGFANLSNVRITNRHRMRPIGQSGLFGLFSLFGWSDSFDLFRSSDRNQPDKQNKPNEPNKRD